MPAAHLPTSRSEKYKQEKYNRPDRPDLASFHPSSLTPQKSKTAFGSRPRRAGQLAPHHFAQMGNVCKQCKTAEYSEREWNAKGGEADQWNPLGGGNEEEDELQGYMAWRDKVASSTCAAPQVSECLQFRNEQESRQCLCHVKLHPAPRSVPILRPTHRIITIARLPSRLMSKNRPFNDCQIMTSSKFASRANLSQFPPRDC